MSVLVRQVLAAAVTGVGVWALVYGLSGYLVARERRAAERNLSTESLLIYNRWEHRIRRVGAVVPAAVAVLATIGTQRGWSL